MAKLHERKEKPSEKKAKVRTQHKKEAMTEADAPSYDRFHGIMLDREDGLEDMATLAGEYLSLLAETARMEKRKKEIRDITTAYLAEAGEKNTQGDFFTVQTVTSRTPKKLSPEKLLEHGVDMDDINDSYEGGNEYTYISILAKE